MEELKYSILVCSYGNGRQFANFLWTACNQKTDRRYEIIVVDNATPNTTIYDAFKKSICKLLKARYFKIEPENKKCLNITQGINYAASVATGKYVVIVADSNVLLSFNLLSSIDNLIDPDSIVLSSGKNDVKISPTGSYQAEYERNDSGDMAKANADLLDQMGWPDDPNSLNLLPGKHRWPTPHLHDDCYIVAMARAKFLELGGYNEDQATWGEYHQNFVKSASSKLKRKELRDVRIIHQYHRVFKGEQDTHIEHARPGKSAAIKALEPVGYNYTDVILTMKKGIQ